MYIPSIYRYMPYNLLTVYQRVLQVELSQLSCAEVEVDHNVRQHNSQKSTYAGSFIFDLHRKFLFLGFAARKRNF